MPKVNSSAKKLILGLIYLQLIKLGFSDWKLLTNVHNFRKDTQFCLISGGKMSNSLLDAPLKCGGQILSFDQNIENAHKVNFYSLHSRIVHNSD